MVSSLPIFSWGVLFLLCHIRPLHLTHDTHFSSGSVPVLVSAKVVLLCEAPEERDSLLSSVTVNRIQLLKVTELDVGQSNWKTQSAAASFMRSSVITGTRVHSWHIPLTGTSRVTHLHQREVTRKESEHQKTQATQSPWRLCMKHGNFNGIPDIVVFTLLGTW